MTWWTLSFVSTGKGCTEEGSGVVAGLVERAVPWIESETGVDLTPCQDDDGQWAPTGACSGFHAGDGAAPEGSWWTSCAGAPRSDLVSTCGPAFDPSGDHVAPTVHIDAPDGETTVDTAPLVVHVFVDATDEESGVAWVGLEVNGELLSARDTLAPYEFADVLFPEGAWVVRAVAEDFAGNRRVSRPIALGVGVPAPSISRLDDGCAVQRAGGRNGATPVWLWIFVGGVMWARRRGSVRSADDGSAAAC